MNHPTFLAGRLLLALPGMFDPRFARAVIALCLHDANGAMGIGVGQLHDGITFATVLQDAGIEPAPHMAEALAKAPVHVGGPVEPQRGFVLHSRDWGGLGTVEVNPLCALSFSQDVLRAIADGRGPSQWLFALGYAGWGEGQLEEELHHHGWHVAQGKSAILFDTPMDRRWTAAWLAEGIDPALLVAQTGNA
jgi:putative transcriptional regulator